MSDLRKLAEETAREMVAGKAGKAFESRLADSVALESRQIARIESLPNRLARMAQEMEESKMEVAQAVLENERVIFAALDYYGAMLQDEGNQLLAFDAKTELRQALTSWRAASERLLRRAADAGSTA